MFNLRKIGLYLFCLTFVQALFSSESECRVKSNTQIKFPNNIYLGDVTGNGFEELIQVSTNPASSSGSANRFFVTQPNGVGMLHHYIDEDIKRLVIGKFLSPGEESYGKDLVCAITAGGYFKCYSTRDELSFFQWSTQQIFIGDDEEAIVGDFNGDGVDEILVYRPFTGSFRMYSKTVVGGRPFFIPTPGFNPGPLSTFPLTFRQIRAGNFSVPNRDGLVVFDPLSGTVKRFDSIATSGVTFSLAFTARVPVTSPNTGDELSVANVDGSPLDSLVFRSRLNGLYRFFRAEYAAGGLQALIGVSAGQLPVIATKNSSIAFRKFAIKTSGEPESKLRDDGIFFSGETNSLFRVDARRNSMTPKTPFSYKAAFTGRLPTLHTGWPAIKKSRWVVMKCFLKDIIPADPQFPHSVDPTQPARYPTGLPAEGFIDILGKTFFVDPLIQDNNFIRNLLSKSGMGLNGIFDYYLENTHGGIAFDNVDIKGWYFTEIDSTKTSRAEANALCKAAAVKGGLDVTKYDGFISLWNHLYDGGNSGWMTMDMDAAFINISQVAHELGHCYGLQHARSNYYSTMCSVGEHWDDTVRSEYCDPFDPMGSGQFFSAGISSYNSVAANPHVNPKFLPTEIKDHPSFHAGNLFKLGMLPASRIATFEATETGTHVIEVKLAPVNRPEVQGIQLIKFSTCYPHLPGFCPLPNLYFTVEFRQPSGWDVNLPDDLVVVNYFVDDHSYLVQQPGFDVSITPPTPIPSPIWHEGYYVSGETARLNPTQSVKVKSIDAVPSGAGLPAATATVIVTY